MAVNNFSLLWAESVKIFILLYWAGRKLLNKKACKLKADSEAELLRKALMQHSTNRWLQRLKRADNLLCYKCEKHQFHTTKYTSMCSLWDEIDHQIQVHMLTLWWNQLSPIWCQDFFDL